MDCSLPGSSVHGIPQARRPEWVAFSFSGGSSQCRSWICVSCIGRQSSLSLSHQGSPSAMEQDAVRRGHTMEFKMICTSSFPIWIPFLFPFLLWLLWPTLSKLCWIIVVRVDTLVLFLTLGKRFQFFTIEDNVCCGFVKYSFYYVEVCPFYACFLESFLS